MSKHAYLPWFDHLLLRVLTNRLAQGVEALEREHEASLKAIKYMSDQWEAKQREAEARRREAEPVATYRCLSDADIEQLAALAAQEISSDPDPDRAWERFRQQQDDPPRPILIQQELEGLILSRLRSSNVL